MIFLMENFRVRQWFC